MIYRHPGKSGAGWYRGDLRDLYMFLTKATGQTVLPPKCFVIVLVSGLL